MNGEIGEILILLLCCWGSAALFFGIGVWAGRREKPMHFWSGTEIDPERVSDIPAYNRENARMWKLYSIPYWLSGAAGLLGVFRSWGSVVCVIILALGCTVGIWWLIHTYRNIEKRYIH